MARTCLHCGNLNDEDRRFCTSCGKPLLSSVHQSGSSDLPQTGPVPAGAQQDPNRLIRRILAVVGILVMVIIIIFFIFTKPGIAGIPPSSKSPVPTSAIVPQITTSDSMKENPSPEQSPPVQTRDLSITSTIPDTPYTRPTPTTPAVCPSDHSICGTDCTDIMTDRTNCGVCGVSCSSSQICQSGRCSILCSVSETRCFDGCHDVLYDAQNCGACGNACPVGLVCNSSVCTPPLPTTIPTYAG